MSPLRRTAALPVLLLASILLAACTQAATGAEPSSPSTAPPTSAPTSLPTSPSVAATTASPAPSSSSASPTPSSLPAGSTAPVAPGNAPTSDDGFVHAQGRSFVLQGRPFRFVGANIYDAAASDRYSCRAGSAMSDSQLLQTLQQLRDRAGVSVIRFWAYQTYTQGATYWGGVDRVLAAARATGMHVIPVLEDGPGDCTTLSPSVSKAQVDGGRWYSSGYREPLGSATLSYRDYVAAITAHYADDPVILGWSMMNEAETSARDSRFRSVLVDFAQDVAGVIRQHDQHHLITVGTQSDGAPGASGPDFTALYSLPAISFAEVHDWGDRGADDQPMPGGVGSRPPFAGSLACESTGAPVGCSFARADRLNKPLIVGEAGITGRTPQERDTRARELRAKMDAAFAAGASGYLVWSVTTGETDGYDVLADSDDPLLEQMRQVAGELG